jgi:hypothetical protein
VSNTLFSTMRDPCFRFVASFIPLTLCYVCLRLIKVDGTETIPVPLFHILDGKRSEDYSERVEPSPSGGKIMAEFFFDIIERKLAVGNQQQGGSRAPTMQFISDR